MFNRVFQISNFEEIILMIYEHDLIKAVSLLPGIRHLVGKIDLQVLDIAHTIPSKSEHATQLFSHTST